jgi:hypothetical protein
MYPEADWISPRTRFFTPEAEEAVKASGVKEGLR